MKYVINVFTGRDVFGKYISLVFKNILIYVRKSSSKIVKYNKYLCVRLYFIYDMYFTLRK